MMKIVVNKRQDSHWKTIREERDRLLEITDKYLIADRLDAEKAEQLVKYRKLLRDLPEQSPATTRLEWPTPPIFVKELQND